MLLSLRSVVVGSKQFRTNMLLAVSFARRLDVARSSQGRGDVTHHEVPLGCPWRVVLSTIPIREKREVSEVSINLWKVNVID